MLTDTIKLTGLQAAQLNKQVHASLNLAAAAAVDGSAAGQALTRFDQLRSIAEQFNARSVTDGATILAPALIAIELAEWALCDAGTDLGEACKRDPIVLEDVDEHLERVIALRDLIATIQPMLNDHLFDAA